jgi:hypothetical protein
MMGAMNRLCWGLASLMVASAAAQSFDFAFYRAQVEPIFLKKRPGHARCVVCHTNPARAFRLQPLPEGTTAWTEEQSRQNFENASHLAMPGKPDSSPLLLHPLAGDAGGDRFHSGGRQFGSKDDPDWKTIADWVRGARLSGDHH